MNFLANDTFGEVVAFIKSGDVENLSKIYQSSSTQPGLFSSYRDPLGNTALMFAGTLILFLVQSAPLVHRSGACQGM